METNGNSILPPNAITLGQAMRPLSSKLRARMTDAPMPRTVAVRDIPDAISHHLGEIADAISGLEAKINDLGDVLSTGGADAEIHRVVGGLEVYLDSLLARHSEVRRWCTGSGSDAQARDLLAGVYYHLLTQIRDWLDELVETIDRPLAAVKRRGLPTSGEVTLRLTLTLTEAPELAGLRRWTESYRLPAAGNTSHAPATRSGLGFWGTVGAVVVGFAIGGSLFGDEE